MPTTKQIDAILPFLDRFEADTFEVGAWLRQPGGFSLFEWSDAVSEFHRALYDNGWISPSFNWVDWQDTARQYVGQPQKVDAADVMTIRKLLTTHVRKERFCEGHLTSMFGNGHVVALLRRLKAIRENSKPA